MLNMPILKFEKSSNYLKSQLKTQNNNKQLILDIITNIGLLNNSSYENKYDELLKCANNYLNNISSNITSIEQLDLEITNITNELNGLLEEQHKASKTKEFYIAAFSNIKHNIILYSKKFQNIEAKLENDNKDFNNFININNFKYTFDSVDSNGNETTSNNYKFTGFSVSEDKNSSDVLENITEEHFNTNPDNIENTYNQNDIYSQENITEHNEEIQNQENNINNDNNDNIEILTNRFKELLLNISEGDSNEDASLKLDEYVKEVKTNLSIPNVSSIDENIINANEDDSNIISDITINDNDILAEETSFIPVFLKYTDEDIEFLNQINKETIIENEVQESNNIENLSQELNENVIVENDIQENNNTEDLVQNIDATVILENDIQENNNIENLAQNLDENVIVENDIQESNNTEDLVQNIDENVILENDIQENNNIENLAQDLDENVIVENDIQESNNTEDLVQNIDETVIIENEVQENNIENLSQNLDKNVIVENDIQESNNTEDLVQNIDETVIIENELQKNNIENLAQNLDENVIVGNDIQESNITEDLVQGLDENVIIESVIHENNNNNNNKINSPTLEDIENLIANVKSSNALSKMEDDFQSIESTFNEIDDLINDNSSCNNTLDSDSILENIDNTDILLDMLNSEEDNEESLLSDNNNNNNNEPIIPSTIENMSFDNLSLSDDDIDKKISDILKATNDNEDLIISERTQKIYLPYKISELINFMDSYPNVYSSLQDVVNQEFILPFDYFQKHPFKSRFSETFNILKNREGKNFFKSMSYSLNLAKKTNLNPAIIAACKSLNELESYIYYMDSNNLKKFKFFNIIYQINLL